MRSSIQLLGVLATLGLAGCATPGPLHVYTLARHRPFQVHDTGPEGAVDVPSYTKAEDGVSGLAYDPYTDCFFLRLAPGNRIRVVDRPRRSVTREFTIPELAPAGGGDLAVRPRDGHLFFAWPVDGVVLETDRFGKFLRQFRLAGLNGELQGIAYDARGDRLLVATTDPNLVLDSYDLNGKLLRSSPLEFWRVESLAYDAAKQEVHAIVLSQGELAIVVFDEEGRLRHRTPLLRPVDFLDVGPRSFVRVF
jgi:hypothetical protein